MARRPWVPGVAMALIGSMLLPAVWDLQVARFLMAGFVLVGLAGALVAAVRKRPADDDDEFDEPLSLAEQRMLRERLDAGLEPEGKKITCRNCGEVFEARSGVCPKCRCFSSG